MLQHRCRHRNAHQHAPSREGRELWFAATNPPTPPNPATPDPADPSKTPDAGNQAEKPKDGGDPAKAPDAVGDVSAETRGQAEGMIKDKEKEIQHVPSAEVLSQRMHTLDQSMQEVTTLIRTPAVSKAMDDLPSEDRKTIWGIVETFDHKRESTAAWFEVTSRLAGWERGDVTPDQYIAYMQEQYRGHPRQAEIVAALQRYKAEHPDQFRDGWQNMNQATKFQIIREMDELSGMKERRREINGYLEEWEQELQGLRKALHEENENARKRQSQEAAEGKTGIFSALGLSFHSPLEIWEAFKMVKDAYKETFMEKLRQKATVLGKGFASALEGMYAPYGAEVAAKMDQKANSEDNKQKNEYKSEIENSNFEELFGETGEAESGILSDVLRADDRPKAMAVLEVAASHGWLYEMAEASPTDWPIYLFGHRIDQFFPKHWSESQMRNYVMSLRGQNRRGADDEKGKGKALVDQEAKPEKYILSLRDQLSRHNYWGAIGVAEGMMARGKLAHASSLIFVNFLRELRQDPIARKFMNINLIEQAGLVSWNYANFTHNLLTMQKDSISNLRGNPNGMDSAGEGARTVARIEAKILAADPSLGSPGKTTQLDEMVARVMSAQTVEVKGRKISIYDKEFETYRTETMKSVFDWYEDNVAKKTPQDFLKQESEAVFADVRFFSELFESGSTGAMDLTDKAQTYCGVLVDKLERMESEFPGGDIAKKFKEETGQKLLAGMRQGASEKSPLKWPDNEIKFTMSKTRPETPLIATLIHKGFFTLNDLLAIPIFGKSADFRVRIQQQLNQLRVSGATGG